MNLKQEQFMATKEWTISNDAGDWVCSVKLTKPPRWQRFKAFASGFTEYPPLTLRIFLVLWVGIAAWFLLFTPSPTWIRVLSGVAMFFHVTVAWSVHKAISDAAHVDELADTCSEQDEAVNAAAAHIEALDARIAELEATVKERDAEIARYVRLNEAWDGFMRTLGELAKTGPSKSKRRGR